MSSSYWSYAAQQVCVPARLGMIAVNAATAMACTLPMMGWKASALVSLGSALAMHLDDVRGSYRDHMLDKAVNDETVKRPLPQPMPVGQASGFAALTP